MNTAVSAEVVVLTASVRVLMVGSRQVTLSVFAQLDDVWFYDMKPMGRVRPKDGGRWVVGVDLNGDLVRSNWDEAHVRPSLGSGDWKRLRNLRASRDRGWAIPPDDISSSRPSRLHPGSTYYKYDGMNHGSLEDAKAALDGLETLADHTKRYSEALTVYEDLPLIVLAGLR